VALPVTFTALRTERLVIRPITLADVDDLHAFQSDPDVVRYEPFEPRTRDEVVEKATKFSQALTIAGDGDFWNLAVERADTPGVIGDLYFKLSSVEHGTGEIGWTLHRAHQGRGYATEGASALLDLAFGVLERHRVLANLDPRNTASAALCRRLGMRQEAHFVEDLWFKGAWGDTAIYAILDREWHAHRRRGGAEAPPRTA
jgi:RimJ/RimL family protein N-acetyltransferase